jgi:choline dehydrogenase
VTNDFDLIVVGAGSAGSAIASRVTEDARVKVLLLEAGPDYPDLDALPGDLRNGNDNSYTAHDWGFSYQIRSDGGPQPFPRGKVVGGSSAVNTCIALRGEPGDYDEWAKIAGDDWTWEKCLPAFRRLESDRDFGDRPHHGADGPVPIRRYRPDELLPIQSAFIAGAREAGFPYCEDHNEPGASGAGPTPMNKRGPHRVSMAEAYVHPARSRPNLTIRPHTLVRRVVFDGTAVRGVELDSGEEIACPNVVLCAGSIMTPPLLVRSGIGPLSTLQGLGVDAVSVLDVGVRLYDHPATAMLLQPRYELQRGVPLMQTLMRWTARDTNDLFAEPMSYVPWFGPDGQFVAVAASVYLSRTCGRLRITSSDPAAAPAIECCFFEDGEDLDLLMEAVRVAYRVATSDAVSEVAGMVAPALEVIEDDEQLRAHICRFCGSGFHPCGTAPMGTDPDAGAVCDQYGRVFGVTGLRIADASIMPTVPRANINIPTIMIGERFGEWLRAELS